MDSMRWEIRKIINVAHELKRTGKTGASTGEQIAAAFVLDRPEYLPEGYTNIVDAWDRLGTWQQHVKAIKDEYMYLINCSAQNCHRTFFQINIDRFCLKSA